MDNLKQQIESVRYGKFENTVQFGTKEYPEDYETIFKQLTPAFTTSYSPYPYQKQAAATIDSIYNLHSNCPPTNLLIASPTGSGKTFAIKWAAYRAVQQGQRLIVAVPLVALAEQIYFELRQLLSKHPPEPELDVQQYDEHFDYYDNYDDDYYSPIINSYVDNRSSTDEDSPVGIRTGPSEKYPNAPVLVCTYEVVLIQMNQNYRFLDNCPLLMIDEIHMISDPSRGHIPENIMNHPNMPYGTKIIGLSGTLPNSIELAEFIGRTNRTETRIIGAKKRPISLDYYIHTGEEYKDTQFHKVYNSEERVVDEDMWEEVQTHKQLEYVSVNQTKTKLLDLVEDLRTDEKLPAMIVGFSCKRLNTLSTYLNSINLSENKRCASMVHIEFNRLKKRIPKEEWCLFERFQELAKRGIGVHHSQNPKHYLELLPKLVKKGFIKLVFATSSLSAGIDLPVRTVVITELKMPTEKGFAQIETNLFHQICGRAGRPGLETQGNVVIVRWKKTKVDVLKMITTPPMPVSSQFRLTPSVILQILCKDDPDTIISTLVLKSFATKSHTYLSSVLQKCIKYSKEAPPKQIQSLLDAMEQLDKIRDDAGYYISKVWKEMKKQFRVGKSVWVDPEKGSVLPVRATIRAVHPNALDTDIGQIQKSWVLYIENTKFKKMDLSTFEVYKNVQRNIQALAETDIGAYSEEEYATASSILDIRRFTAQLKSDLSPETSGLWDEYQRQLTILKKHGFLDSKEMPTLKGKMAAGVLSTEDPLTLVEFITQAEYSTAELVPLLTCFLRKKRKQDPPGPDTYKVMVRLQKAIWTVKNETLGTTMIHPMTMWMKGHSVADIVDSCDISVGHFCKEALRMKEMLRQLMDVCKTIGNVELEQLFREQNAIMERGLPFLPSSMIK